MFQCFESPALWDNSGVILEARAFVEPYKLVWLRDLKYEGNGSFMAKIRFIEHAGEEHEVEAQAGGSVMLAALTNGVPGIDADCGGACSCATCHVYVQEDWLDKVGDISPTEEAMLSLSTDRQDNSRLSCQIEITDELDGLVVTTPEFQF